MTQVRIYVEGGGEKKDTKRFLRTGFGCFLRDLRYGARRRRIRWDVIVCGARSAAYQRFVSDLEDGADAFNVLLVDSEGPVRGHLSPREHLREHDQWDVGSFNDDQAHLMVQTMEAWLIADHDALEHYYGQGFRRTRLPATDDVERVDRRTLQRSLKAATRDTARGEYHKTHHAWRLLQRVDVGLVGQRARHCNRLFETLTSRIEGTP